jgi:hypothetical protein
MEVTDEFANALYVLHIHADKPKSPDGRASILKLRGQMCHPEAFDV